MKASTEVGATRCPKLQPLLDYLDSLNQRADLATLHRWLGTLSVTRFGDDESGRRLLRLEPRNWTA